METGNEKEGRFSRRDFLLLAGGMISAVSLGSMPLAGCSHGTALKLPESSSAGEGRTGKRLLVAYASQHGSTGGVAEAIGEELCNRGAAVDVRMLKNVGDLNEYRGVVVGSAIYRGKWLPEAVDFVERNRAALQQVPVAYFLVCMTMCEPTEENRRKALAYLDPVLKAVPHVRPVKVGTFAGALNYSNLSLPIKVVMKLKGAPEGDFRRWAAIRAWAGSLHEIHALADSLHPVLVRV